MRIIPKGTVVHSRDCRTDAPYMDGSIIAPCVDLFDTIEITDVEWDDIYRKYRQYCIDVVTGTYDEWTSIGFPIPKPFSQYLKELIKLKQGI